MMMSREASRLAGDFGTLVPNASRHRLSRGRRWSGRRTARPGRPWRRVRLRNAFALTSLPCQPRPAA